MSLTHSRTENEQNSTGESQAIQDCINTLAEQETWSLFRALTDNDVFEIANALKTNKKCRDLECGYMKLTGAYHLAEMLKVNTTLQHLWLVDTEIGDTGAQAICEVLKNENKTLKYLTIQRSHITDASVPKIIEMMQMNKTVTDLWLGGNWISEFYKHKIWMVSQKTKCRLDFS